MTEDISNVSFLGLTNMAGDSRDQIFIYYRGCSSGCGFVYTFELRSNRLQPMTFHSGGSGLMMDSSGVEAGFTCRIVNGIHEVVAFIGQNGIDIGGPVFEYIYQADRNGDMDLINERNIVYTSKQIEATVGAHCPGLHIW